MPFTVKKAKGIDTSSLEKLGGSVVDLAKYTEDELRQVAAAFQGTEAERIWNSVPPKPRRGTIVYADGTNWNPGAGEGPYYYNSGGAWKSMTDTIGSGWWSAGDAPSDGTYYGRQNSAWHTVTPEAPNDGQSYLRKSLAWAVAPAIVAPGQLHASLGADVLLNNTANYFDGPSIAQGTVGTWWVSGTVTVIDTASTANINCKLWDGTTVIASCNAAIGGAGFNVNASLSGWITSPAGNLRISCRDTTSASGKIVFNFTGNSKDSTISAYRIA